MATFLAVRDASGQIDPEKRKSIQLGYNQPLEGRSPLAAYAFYYLNEPNWPGTNVTLRLAVAPVYMDSELGFSHALGDNTDLGLGLAGGGFANSYFEFRDGKYLPGESFTGHGGDVSASVYHLFNPGDRIPLNGVFRINPHYMVYQRDDQTKAGFVIPQDHASFNIRSGLRWGGREPVMVPELAMELSGWYEGQVRTDSQNYGFNGDRHVEEMSHLFWARALLIYTFPESKQRFDVSLTAGTSIHPDHFSAYRLGGNLPLSAEFPLLLPGYYYQELSARSFAAFSGQYTLPLDAAKRWSLTAIGTVANLRFLEAIESQDHNHAGVGMGLGYRSASGVWQMQASYGYGIEALRTHGHGGQEIGILCQIDLEARHHHRGPVLDEGSPAKSRGLMRFLQNMF